MNVKFLHSSPLVVTYLFIGSSFWRTAKKVRAVLLEDYQNGMRPHLGTKRSHSDSPSDSKKPTMESLEGRLMRLEESLSSSSRDKCLILESEITSLKVKLSMEKDVIERIASAYKCTICMKYPVQPLYKAPCCEEVLGCHGCVEEWISNSPSCPLCRAPLSKNTLVNIPVIKPLDDVLSKIKI